jgi:3-dehydroquinate synthase
LERITINTPSGHSEIQIGNAWENLKKLLPEKGVVIVTDNNIKQLYGSGFPDFPVFALTPGEESKKLETIEKLSVKLLETGIDRSGFILGIGGGVVCDVAGFLASVYMRGIRCGYVSTSLLSQVDASTGGKTGVNLGGTKNILGTIRQPEFVICDPQMLSTLSDAEYLSGLAELIKTAIIGDYSLFNLIEDKQREIAGRDPFLMTELVAKCISFKASVVSEDENETGLRRILNFGHTFGHAIEMHEAMKHGFAVASGMELASAFSAEKGLISKADHDRIVKMLSSFGLLGRYNIDEAKMSKLILNDKKKSGSGINFVLINAIGHAVVENIAVGEILDFYRRSGNTRQ